MAYVFGATMRDYMRDLVCDVGSSGAWDAIRVEINVNDIRSYGKPDSEKNAIKQAFTWTAI